MQHPDPILGDGIPHAVLRLLRRAADAQRTGATGVVVVRLDDDRIGPSTALLRFAHALGLRTILDAGAGTVERLVTQRPELVGPTLRAADAVVVPSARSAALVGELTGGRVRVEVADSGGTAAVQRLRATLTAA